MTENTKEPKTSPPARFLRLREVLERTGLSRSTIYVRLDQGRSPRPVPLGGPRGALGRGRGGRVDRRADRGEPDGGDRPGSMIRRASWRPGNGSSGAPKVREPAYTLGPRFACPLRRLAGGCAPSDPRNGNGAA